MKAVLDANVLVSALASPSGAPGKILSALIQELFDCIVSEYILNETQNILITKLEFGTEEVRKKLSTIAILSNVVEPYSVSQEKILPNDWPILGTTLAGNADFLVTGDKLLLNLKYYHGTNIITPNQFLKLL